jgi:hypothetical protein
LLKKNASRIKHLILGFFAGAIITHVITLSFSHVNGESALMLIIFDFLFISLVFPLDGTFAKKIMLLLVGNVIGLLWNSIFCSFAYVADCYFGNFFNTLYVILNPLLNFLWVISFWSISLSVLSSSKQRM